VSTSLPDLVAWLERQGAEVSTRGDLGSAEITGLSLSSQRIRQGDMYAALPGARAHGFDFAAEAENGAEAVELARRGGHRRRHGDRLERHRDDDPDHTEDQVAVLRGEEPGSRRHSDRSKHATRPRMQGRPRIRPSGR
jgi:hypothetical protein